ncbi:MAG: hypothetical protein LKJ03_03340 [Enterococcaceae bacterium]|jgi:septal ring factor EnvC (AmiA/AmiB activator)|nr:hypothetical protein [Enterococcaceae bacterium]MCI1919017.1 hypothetical protein [Enterococcaceae bacterium]
MIEELIAGLNFSYSLIVSVLAYRQWQKLHQAKRRDIVITELESWIQTLKEEIAELKECLKQLEKDCQTLTQINLTLNHELKQAQEGKYEYR